MENNRSKSLCNLRSVNVVRHSKNAGLRTKTMGEIEIDDTKDVMETEGGRGRRHYIETDMVHKIDMDRS
jgi:hypothetical protein